VKKENVERFYDLGPKDNPAYQQLLAAARNQVAMMDKVDEKHGFAHHDLLMSVRDAVAAISAGMHLKSCATGSVGIGPNFSLANSFYDGVRCSMVPRRSMTICSPRGDDKRLKGALSSRAGSG